MTEIIIFAAAAAFLGYKLYTVLGERTGHEQGFAKPEETTVPPVRREPVNAQPQTRRPSLDGRSAASEEQAVLGLRAIAAADRSFTPEHFVDGAKQAYRMVLEAFWKGDLSDVESLLDQDVASSFREAIAAREAAGETVDNRLATIERVTILSASQVRGIATVSVRFDADIAAVTRNRAGEVVAGSLTDAVPARDVWTFSRDVRAADPNWILVDTDEVSESRT